MIGLQRLKITNNELYFRTFSSYQKVYGIILVTSCIGIFQNYVL